MDDFLTLRAYQEYLRDRMEAARANSGVEQIVLFGFTSAGRHFLVDGRDVVDVHQISQLQPIPMAKPWAVGAANIKGSVLAVTDFSILLGGERTKKGKFMVLVPEVTEGAAILIESIAGLYELKDVGELSPLSLTEDSGMPSWISGSYHIGQRHYMVDTMKMAQDVRFSKLQSGDSQ